MKRLEAWLGPSPTGMVPGRPSWAYTLGWMLVMLLVVQAVTGAALSAFYSASSTSAWASVAYVQDRMPGGWLVRGLHFHGASALVIICGAHLVQTAVYGAYKKPRELVWWLGIVLMLLVLAFAISGYVLRWDQAGYWANRVELGIAAGTPILGGAIRDLALGGNDYGNLTLTRFYALHVVLLPAIVTALVLAHVVVARRHGPTPLRLSGDTTRRWPQQTLRDVTAMALAFAVLLGYAVATHGADLAAPADPSSAFDARPLWYFRWLFELRHLAGSYERFAALIAPALVAGFLVGLPFLDRGEERAPRKRMAWLGGVIWVIAMIGVLTMMSFVTDHDDADLAKRLDQAAQLATKARALAAKNGVPATGPADLFTTAPLYRARQLYATRCKGCHDADSKDRKGPIIAAGHGNRDWIRNFLKGPSSDAYYGHTKLAKTDDAMKAVDLAGGDLDDLIELLYSQSGAADVDPARRDRGLSIFNKACTDCHSIDEGVAGASGPNLAGLDSRDYFTSFISNPKSPVHMTSSNSEMPRFDKELTIVDRDALAEYLVWLRTHTKQDLDSL